MTEAWMQDEVVQPAPAAPAEAPVAGPQEVVQPSAEPAPAAAPQIADWEAEPEVLPASALANIDRETGGDLRVRMALTQAESPADQLAVVRQVYPDAQWMEFGGGGGTTVSRQTGAQVSTPVREPERHIVFTHPETGKPTTLNPAGLDWGDVAAFGPGVLRMGAYTVGSGLAAIPSGGNPVAMTTGGTAASQAVKYATTPIMEAATGLDVPDTRSLREKVLAGITDAGVELLSGGAGEVVGAAMQKGQSISRNWRRIRKFKPSSKFAKRQVFTDLEEMALEQGKAPIEGQAGSLAMVHRSPTLRSLFQALSKYPRSSDIMREAVDNTDDVIRTDFARVHAAAGGTKEIAVGGQAAQGGLRKWVDNLATQQEKLEMEVARKIGNESVDATATLAYFEDIIARAKQGGANKSIADIIPPRFQRLYADLKANKGRMGFATLREYKSKLGNIAYSGKIQYGPGDETVGELRHLEDLLQQDLTFHAMNKGGGTHQTWTRANKNWMTLRQGQEVVQSIMDAPTAKQAWDRMMTGVDKDPSRLQAVLQRVDRTTADQIRSAWLWDMGTTSSTAGAAGETVKVYHPAMFARKWRDMSESARGVLTQGNPRLKQMYDRMVRMAAAWEDAYTGKESMVNFSGTSAQIAAMDMLGDGGAAAVLAGDIKGAVTMAGKKGAAQFIQNKRAEMQARLMTDPDFVAWFLDGSKVPPNNPKALGRWVSRLGAVTTGKSPRFKEAVLDYLGEWRASLNEAQEDTPPPPGTTNASI